MEKDPNSQDRQDIHCRRPFAQPAARSSVHGVCSSSVRSVPFFSVQRLPPLLPVRRSLVQHFAASVSGVHSFSVRPPSSPAFAR